MKTLLLLSCLLATALAGPWIQVKKPCGFFPFSPCPAAAGKGARWTPLKKPCGFFPFPLCPAARKKEVIDTVECIVEEGFEVCKEVEVIKNRVDEDVIEVRADEEDEAVIVTIDKDVEVIVDMDVEARKDKNVAALEVLDVEARKEVEVEAKIEEEINEGHQ